jgi:trimethylamine--corrinoid protein Co-methyltransferase
MRIARRAGGALEHGLMSASMGQFGRYYGLPSLGGAGYNTANEAGDQSCLEKVFCGLLPFANADIIEGFGCIEDGKTLSFAQLVIDAEIVQMFHRLTQKIEVNDTTLALDLIHKVKPGGTYLTERHTNDYLRNEHYIPSLIKRQFYETWVKDGSKSIADLAREKAKKIVETTSIKPLEKDIQDEIATVVKEADKELSKSR